ncbi:MAG: GNAT family N-acetyltransferase [Arcanobacterium sp.]|nr:GNAT family N-acetyltransferase [Arcanobacterium sp.]
MRKNRDNSSFEPPAFDEQTFFTLKSASSKLPSNLRVIGILDSQKQNFLALSIIDFAQHKIELAVLPQLRKKGFGAMILRRLQNELGAEFSEFSFWAHGDLPGSRELAKLVGLEAYRKLLVLEKDLLAKNSPLENLPLEHLIPGNSTLKAEGFSLQDFVIRPIKVSETAELMALVELNQQAFRNHPEQGKLLRENFVERFAQTWFDSELLFGVFIESKLRAYLWLKPESAEELELYVLGISPHYQGQGLGKILTSLAVHTAIARGYKRVILYVDAENTAAMSTYLRAGFVERERHFAYKLR